MKMRDKVEYRRLGDVADYINGYAFKPEDWKESGLPIIRIQNLNNTNATFNYYDGIIDNKYLVKNGDLLISWSASLGAYIWNGSIALLNQHIFKVVFGKSSINKRFLKYAVNCKLDAMKSMVHGVTMQHIVKKDFDNTLIPYPPIEEQERIVAELDLISGVIEKQKAQLKELDNLAQSIFYDMFGDIETNEKRWRKEPIGEVCYLKAGRGIKASELIANQSKGLYPCYGGNGVRGYIAKKSHTGCFPIIGRQGALCGNVNLATGVFYATEHAVVCSPSALLNPIFLFYALMKMNLNQYAKGVAQPGLAVANITPLLIIIPPLDLQESFAQKIQAIEQQKACIKNSIKEMETLLQSRMDYYFD